MATVIVLSGRVRRLLHQPWFVPAVILIISAGVYALSAARPVQHLDVWATNFLSWYLAHGLEPWFDGVSIPGIDGHPTEHAWIIESADGHRTIGRSPGPVAAGMLAYWVLGGAGPSMMPGALAAALLTGLTLTLFYLAIRPRLPLPAAVLATVVLGFTTPVWTVAADGLWPHTITILGIAGMAWAAHREQWWLVGVFGGVVVWGRLHAAVIVAVLGLGIAWSRRSPRIAAIVGGISLGFLALVCVWDRWVYGTWSPMASYDVGAFTGYAGDHRLDVMNQLGFWISLDRGILVWTPAILLLIPALVRGWRGVPDWSRWLLVAGLLYTFLQGSLNRYSGGDSIFPYRLGLEVLVCAAPSLAFAAASTGQRTRLYLGPVLTLQFCFIFMASGMPEALVPGEDGPGGWMLVLLEHHRMSTVIALLLVVVGLGLGPRIVADRLMARRAT